MSFKMQKLIKAIWVFKLLLFLCCKIVPFFQEQNISWCCLFLPLSVVLCSLRAANSSAWSTLFSFTLSVSPLFFLYCLNYWIASYFALSLLNHSFTTILFEFSHSGDCWSNTLGSWAHCLLLYHLQLKHSRAFCRIFAEFQMTVGAIIQLPVFKSFTLICFR